MKFDEWTTEAHRSLQEWDPEPAIPPASAARHEIDDPSSADPVVLSAWVEPSPVRGRPPASTGRRLLSAAAVFVVFVAAAAALVTQVVIPANTDVATGSRTEATQTAGEPSTTVATSDPGAGPSSAPQFSCVAADPEKGASTDVFDDTTEVADWRAVDVDPPPAASAQPNSVTGTLIGSQGEDVTGTASRAEAFVAALAPGWFCTVESPTVDVADPSRPGQIVDETNTVTNRLGGMCFVPDASAAPDSVWGVAPSLAAALDHVDGLTSWSVVLADGGGNGQGPGRLWMEFMFEADPDATDRGPTDRVLADVSAAVNAAGDAAGVPTECTVH